MARSKSEVVQMAILDVEAAEAQIVAQSKRIEFYITELSIEILAQKMRDGEYEVPPYQREFTWEAIRKSRFLESLLMGLPIPFIFFWEMPDGRLEIVDGSQRLRTLEEFLLGDFRLGELEQLSAVSGFGFKDLPESRQRKFRNRSIRGIVLNEHADEAARFDMFERINTGSKIANPAELRRGALGGPFMQLVITLARDEQFVKLTPMSAKSEKERAREELVARFFAYGDGLDGYHDRPREFVFEYAKIMNQKFAADPELADSYSERFFRMVSFVDEKFPNGFKKNSRSQATAKARFEAIAVGSYLALSAKPELEIAEAGELAIDSWIESSTFVERTSSDGANAIARLRGRFDYVRDRLLGLPE